jgi:hypothetical protein
VTKATVIAPVPINPILIISLSYICSIYSSFSMVEKASIHD